MSPLRAHLLLAILFAASVPRSAPAMWQRCVDFISNVTESRFFNKSLRAFVGAPTVVESPDWHQTDFLELQPEFAWIRENLQLYLIERHSGVRFYRSNGKLIARLPLGKRDLKEDFLLNATQEDLLDEVAKYNDLRDLPIETRTALIRFFRHVVCPRIFHRPLSTLVESEGDSLRHIVSNVATRWSLKNDGEYVGYQVEGWLDKNGRPSYVAPMNHVPVWPPVWAVTQIYIRDGVVEIRAFDTATEVKGYRFLRFALSELLGTEGELRSSFEMICLNHYNETLAEGTLVNGSRFPWGHAAVSRALEIGLDPENRYRPYDYRQKVVFFRRGAFEGLTGFVVEQKERGSNTMAGRRQELWIEISGHNTAVRYSNSFIYPLDKRLLEKGIDPLTREYFVFAEGEKIFVRTTGERGTVVGITDPKRTGREASYRVELESRPGEPTSLPIGELAPVRYFHPALIEVPKAP